MISSRHSSALKNLRTYSGSILPAVLVAALLLFSALAVAARAWLRPSATEAKPATPVTTVAKVRAPTSAAATQGNSGKQALEAEIITITPYGFEPQQLTRPKGRFTLMVDNRSGRGDMDLQLDRQTGARLHAVKVSKEQLDWHDEFDLPPGSYVLTEAGHPQWACRIIITPQ